MRVNIRAYRKAGNDNCMLSIKGAFEMDTYRILCAMCGYNSDYKAESKPTVFLNSAYHVRHRATMLAYRFSAKLHAFNNYIARDAMGLTT